MPDRRRHIAAKHGHGRRGRPRAADHRKARCDTEAKEATQAQTCERHARVAPDWLKQATVYQVWLRSFSSEGTLKAVTARLPYLADLGVTFVYLSPFMKGPHPFKPSDYYAINPEHGTEEDLRALVDDERSEGPRRRPCGD